MPLLFSRPRRRVLFEIHEPCPGAFRYFGLRISVDESSELAETLRLVARPREIKVYEPVRSENVVFRRNSRQPLYGPIQLLPPPAQPRFRVQLGHADANLRRLRPVLVVESPFVFVLSPTTRNHRVGLSSCTAL